MSIWLKILQRRYFAYPTAVLGMAFGACYLSQTDQTWNPLPTFRELPNMILTCIEVSRGTSPRLDRLVDADAPTVVALAKIIQRLDLPLRYKARSLEYAALAYDYADDFQVYGELDHFAGPREAEALRQAHGWIRPRGDCEDIALFVASVAQACGVQYRIRIAIQHAWCEVYDGETWLSINSDDSSSKIAAPPTDLAENHSSEWQAISKDRFTSKTSHDAFLSLLNTGKSYQQYSLSYSARQRTLLLGLGGALGAATVLLPIFFLSLLAKPQALKGSYVK